MLSFETNLSAPMLSCETGQLRLPSSWLTAQIVRGLGKDTFGSGTSVAEVVEAMAPEPD